VTVDSDQDRLMVAFNTVPACLWVGGDPDFSLYAISEGLAVMTGECPVHGHHQDVVLSLLNGQLGTVASGRRASPASSKVEALHALRAARSPQSDPRVASGVQGHCCICRSSLLPSSTRPLNAAFDYSGLSALSACCSSLGRKRSTLLPAAGALRPDATMLVGGPNATMQITRAGR
jgi:hypothetical protein